MFREHLQNADMDEAARDPAAQSETDARFGWHRFLGICFRSAVTVHGAPDQGLQHGSILFRMIAASRGRDKSARKKIAAMVKAAFAILRP
jgi:hypothetical protein